MNKARFFLKKKIQLSNSIGFILSPIKIVCSLLSKTLLFSILGVGEYSDTFFLSLNIASSVCIIASSLFKPAFYSLISDSKDYIDMKIVVKEQSGFLILISAPVALISLFIAFLYSKSLDDVLSRVLVLSSTLFSLSGILAEIIQCNTYFMRLKGRNWRADLLNGCSPILLSLLPILLVYSFGINGFAVGNFIAALILSFYLFTSLNSFPKLPSASHFIKIKKVATKMIGVASVSKLFPFVESFSILSLGSGLYAMYALAKSIYSSIIALLSLGFLQRLIARIQLNISASKYIESLSLIRKNSSYITIASSLVFSSCIFLWFALTKSGLLLTFIVGFDLTYLFLLGMSLFPFFVASVCSQFIMPSLYALDDLNYVASTSIISFLIFSSLMIPFSKVFGVVGTCLAVSMYFTVNSLIFYKRLIFLLSKRIIA